MSTMQRTNLLGWPMPDGFKFGERVWVAPGVYHAARPGYGWVLGEHTPGWIAVEMDNDAHNVLGFPREKVRKTDGLLDI